MRAGIMWTETQDATLRRMRLDGISYDIIGTHLGLHRETVRARAKEIGAVRPPPPPSQKIDPDRPPLRPGDPISWGAITKGTVLEGEPYPMPLFG
jgi:hypothetical protein